MWGYMHEILKSCDASPHSCKDTVKFLTCVNCTFWFRINAAAFICDFRVCNVTSLVHHCPTSSPICSAILSPISPLPSYILLLLSSSKMVLAWLISLNWGGDKGVKRCDGWSQKHPAIQSTGVPQLMKSSS